MNSYVIAAMCGCWKRESGVNPGIWESLIPCPWDYEYQYTGRGGFGLGQWTNIGTPHGRCYNLHQYCVNNGYADGSGPGQINFVIAENYWTGTSPRLGFNSLSEFLNSDSTSLGDLVYDFLACWEGVPGNAYQERYEAASFFLQYISEHAADPVESWQWYSYNNYMGFKSSEQCNNVMMIFHQLNGVDPGPDPPPGPPTPGGGFPVWMLYKFNKFKNGGLNI